MLALYLVFNSCDPDAPYDAVFDSGDARRAYFVSGVTQFVQSWEDEDLQEGVYSEPELVAALKRVSGVAEFLIGRYPAGVPAAPHIPSDFENGVCDMAVKIYDADFMMIFSRDVARLERLGALISVRCGLPTEFTEGTM